MEYKQLFIILVMIILVVGCSNSKTLNPKVQGSVQVTVISPGELLRVSYYSPDHTWKKSKDQLSKPLMKSINQLRQSMKIVSRTSKPKGFYIAMKYEYLTIFISLKKNHQITVDMHDHHYFISKANHDVIKNLLRNIDSEN